MAQCKTVKTASNVSYLKMMESFLAFPSISLLVCMQPEILNNLLTLPNKYLVHTLIILTGSIMLTCFSYIKNAQKLAAMIAKKPMKPKELVVKWTEFVAEFKDLSNLDLAGRDFNFIKYYSLDIFIPVIVIAIAALFIVLKTVRYLLNVIRRFMSVKEKKC